MPFKSEKQRRYLWANEPEIARDWTDTYGSRIQKNTGGITRIPFQGGGADYQEKEKGMSPGRSMAQFGHAGHGGKTEDQAKSDQRLGNDRPDSGPGSNPYAGHNQQEKIGFQKQQDINKAVDEGFFKPGPKTAAKKPSSYSFWSPEVHYNLALNLPGAKKSRIANMRAYKEYLESQGITDLNFFDPEDLSYEQFQRIKQFQPTGITDKDALLKALQNTTMTNMPVTAVPQNYEEFMLTQRNNPNLFVSGDVGNFWNKPRPKDLVNPNTGSYYTNAEWDALKRDIIQDRGYSTGNEHYGGVPGAVPFGDMPLWQQQGFNSYEDWLATQGGGTGGTGGTTTTQVANTGWPYKDYGTKDYQTSNTFMDLAYPGGYNFLLAKGGRVPAAFGGIMDTETGRRGYFLGSIKKAFKGVAKAAGKVLKSDVGKLALLGAGAYFGPMAFGQSAGFGSWGKIVPKTGWMANLLRSKGADGAFGALSPWKLAGIGMTAAPFLGIGTKAKQDASVIGDRGGHLIDPLTGQESLPGGMRQTLNDALADAWDEKEQAYDAAKMSTIKQAYPFLGQYPIFQVAKDGGRIGAQEGGLMDLGGMEKDYRNNGGFVAIGGEERADDVPARLSRNEFVFTADAVRGAGGGDIDKGAEIMENVMKNLEQGGKISEETQGNTGAQEMFSVSERIGEVL